VKRVENCRVAHRPGSQWTATGTAENGSFQPEGRLISDPCEQYYLILLRAILA